MNTILIADDEKNIRDGLAQFATSDGYTAITAADGQEALQKARTLSIDCALIDLRMPQMGGAALLATLVSEQPTLPVIIITGHGTVENAVAAMHNGAYDFVTKPVNLDRLSALIKRALANRTTILKNQILQSELDAHRNTSVVASASPAMQRVMRIVEQVAKTDATVLITGESGVGKEVVADSIHAQSPRHAFPMIKVHCASLTETLLESELFGHEKGAFTGATAQRKGRFELANNGTIFLDEIGEINQSLQVKILRVLQEKKFERVGGEQTISADVRIIAATNRDLSREIADGRFREDLYYRLNVVRIEIPPLRERKEDIPLLIDQFLREFGGGGSDGAAKRRLSLGAQKTLLAYRWPGNIRELRNCIESAVILSDSDVIDTVYLPTKPAANSGADSAVASADSDSSAGGTATSDSIAIPQGSSLEDAEKILINHALAATHGNKTKTASLLGIQRVTLYDKIRKYGLNRS